MWGNSWGSGLENPNSLDLDMKPAKPSANPNSAQNGPLPGPKSAEGPVTDLEEGLEPLGRNGLMPKRDHAEELRSQNTHHFRHLLF